MRFSFKKDKKASVLSVNPDQTGGLLNCAVYTLSETGPVRSHNEDSIAFAFPDGGQRDLLAVLADGMGGHSAGEVASRMACEQVIAYVSQHKDNEPPGKILESAFQQAHRQILEAGEHNSLQKGMGTTATAVLIRNGLLHFAHIGDSRLYRYHAGALTQCTKDHTLVNQMYEKGEITGEERQAHPMRNVLLQALGTTGTISPQSEGGLEIDRQDKYLLCSDGVYDICTVAELEALMRMDNPSFALECLRCIAIQRKASDNFSAIVISFSGAPLPTAAAPITREQKVLL